MTLEDVLGFRIADLTDTATAVTEGVTILLLFVTAIITAASLVATFMTDDDDTRNPH